MWLKVLAEDKLLIEKALVLTLGAQSSICDGQYHKMYARDMKMYARDMLAGVAFILWYIL